MNSEKIRIELIPVKRYKKGLVFLVAKTLKNIRNDFQKLPKMFSQQFILFKADASL